MELRKSRVPRDVIERIGDDSRALRVAETFSKHFSPWGPLESADDRCRFKYFYLNPTITMREQFALNREVLCILAEYDDIQIRLLGLAHSLLEKNPERLESDVFFLITDAANAASLTATFFEKSACRVVVATWRDIFGSDDDYPVELLRQFFFKRDLFNQSTAVADRVPGSGV
jgi:hypothetical protein